MEQVEVRRNRHIVWMGLLIAVLMHGLDLSDGDLAMQQVLVEVRRNADSFPGDIVADAAAAHPGAWLDLRACLPASWGLDAALAIFFAGLTFGGAARLARMQGATSVGCVLAMLFLAGPRLGPGWISILPAAPVSRAIVVPLLLWMWTSKGWVSWILGGLAMAVHPAIGATGFAALVAQEPRRVPVIAVGLAVFCPILGEALWLQGDSPMDSLAVHARWMHHLDVSVGAWVWVGAVWLRAWKQRVSVVLFSFALLGALVAEATFRGWLPLEVARIHPLHATVPLVLWVLVEGARRVTSCIGGGWRQRVGGIALGFVLAFGGRPENTPFGDWVAPPRVPEAVVGALDGMDVSRPILVDPRKGVTLRSLLGRPVVVTVKDGGEVVASGTFGQTWRRRLSWLCGPLAVPQDRTPGYVWLRAQCALPQDAMAWKQLAHATKAAVVVVPRNGPMLDWPVLAEDETGRWFQVPGAWSGTQ